MTKKDVVDWQRLEPYIRRRPATTDCKLALDELHANLTATSIFYQRSDLEGQRHAVARSIELTIDFLNSQGFPPLILDTLKRVERCLFEIDDNRRDPLFSAKQKAGRPNRTFADDARASVLVVLANLWLMATEEEEGTQESKLKRAARAMTGTWFGSVSYNELKSARERFSSCAKDDRLRGLVRVNYDVLGVRFENLSPTEAFHASVKYFNDLPRYGHMHGTNLKTPPFSPAEET
ncbi:hypothetical protein [Novosphingobium sp. KACC 22771]|uniref:hypothetical protein n=1 Tax=Novosphingobium sp. KACC 22771 TaxID=3025670 RepID=UPI00236726F2|nr:hypothetical protein [Novosphingobium sp. KACC 22771]WDF73939.1 hypothetical protein PQ467_07870 [Novosphingobium sp. KACC 22771]